MIKRCSEETIWTDFTESKSLLIFKAHLYHKETAPMISHQLLFMKLLKIVGMGPVLSFILLLLPYGKR